MTTVYVLLGGPGSGKGTQAELLSNKYGVKHISTGELVRKEVLLNSEVGKKVKPYIDNGNLIPDEIIVEIFKKNFKLSNTNNGFVVDGFPRTSNQAKVFDELLNVLNLDSVFFYLKVDIDNLIDRLNSRKRDDDKKLVIEQRIKIYLEQMEQLLVYYKQRINIIDGNNAPEEVFSSIERMLVS